MRRLALWPAISLGIALAAALAAALSLAPAARAGTANPPQAASALPADPLHSHFVHIRHTADYYRQHPAVSPNLPAAGVPYNNGPVVISLTVYTIFWDPGNTISGTFQSLVNRYFADMGNSGLYNVATQYYQSPPTVFISSHSGFGGTYHDTASSGTGNGYPGGRGTPGDPLTDADIQHEVSTTIAAQGWPDGGLGAAFFVFTAKGIESCADPQNCTGGTIHPTMCAYHGSFDSGGITYLYGGMPYQATWTGCNGVNFNPSPNNFDADEEIDVTSHEHMELVTDPTGTGWWGDVGACTGCEIGDICDTTYGSTTTNGSDVTLNGNPYLVQSEWSNAALACVMNYSVDTRVGQSGPAFAMPGSNLTYTLSITNGGPQPANGVMLQGGVPAHSTFVALTQSSGAAFSCARPNAGATGPITCTLNTLANGAAAAFSLVVHLDGGTPDGATISNTLTLSESAYDSNFANNTSTVHTIAHTPFKVFLPLIVR